VLDERERDAADRGSDARQRSQTLAAMTRARGGGEFWLRDFFDFQTNPVTLTSPYRGLVERVTFEGREMVERWLNMVEPQFSVGFHLVELG
jgi:hypothetical protein